MVPAFLEGDDSPICLCFEQGKPRDILPRNYHETPWNLHKFHVCFPGTMQNVLCVEIRTFRYNLYWWNNSASTDWVLSTVMICGCDCDDVHHWSMIIPSFWNSQLKRIAHKVCMGFNFNPSSPNNGKCYLIWLLCRWNNFIKAMALNVTDPQGLPCLGLCTGPEASAGKTRSLWCSSWCVPSKPIHDLWSMMCFENHVQ